MGIFASLCKPSVETDDKQTRMVYLCAFAFYNSALTIFCEKIYLVPGVPGKSPRQPFISLLLSKGTFKDLCFQKFRYPFSNIIPNKFSL